MKHAIHIFTVYMFFVLAGCSAVDPWQEASVRDTKDAYEEYLREHPDGAHAKEARGRLEALCFEEVSKEEYIGPNEYRIKCLSVLRDIRRGYEQFLKEYPRSVHLQEVKARLEQLRAEEQEYKAALRASAAGDILPFVTFLNAHPHYGLGDLLALLRTRGDDNCVKSLGELLIWYDCEARKKSYPISAPGVIFLGPSSDGEKRIEIISALRETDKDSAIPYIIRSLTDPEKAIATYGFRAFAGATGPATYYYPVREAAAEALKQMTGQDFGTDQGKWKRWWENRRREKGRVR